MRKWLYIAAAVAGVGLLSRLGYSVVGTGQNAQLEQKVKESASAARESGLDEVKR